MEITPCKDPQNDSYKAIILTGKAAHPKFTFVSLTLDGTPKKLTGLPALSPGYTYTLTIAYDPLTDDLVIQEVEIGEWGATSPRPTRAISKGSFPWAPTNWQAIPNRRRRP